MVCGPETVPVCCTDFPHFGFVEVAVMPETLIVSSRGQITLPATLRKRLGIAPGDVLIVEDRGGGLVFKPAAVLPVEVYDDEQIAVWDQDDALDDAERARILDAVQGKP
ncbi:AbrB/MazE/SpoVT family DNA-binding domain-containing protein, partial [Thiohalocapsa halophila]